MKAKLEVNSMTTKDNNWEEEFVEKGAALEHDRWARWQEYMFSQCRDNDGGGKIVPLDLFLRWTRQINTPYSELSEKEKESDRKETRNYLPLISKTREQAKAEGYEKGKKTVDPNKISEEFDEFTIAKSWELDKDKFYVEASPEEIKASLNTESIR